MIQAMVKKLNGKRLRQRISSAILIVAILVSFSGILGGAAMLVMGVQYNHALTNYGFSQGDPHTSGPGSQRECMLRFE